MKVIFAVLLMTAILLSGCNGTPDAPPNPTVQSSGIQVSIPPETTQPAVSEAPETMPPQNTDSDLMSVLSGDLPVWTEFGISQPLAEYFRENYSATITAFTLLDMNHDGENEMVVETDSPAFSYGVIHFDGDTAYAYPFGSRQLGRLKADGSFAGSSSAFNSLYMTMDFADGNYTTQILAECEYREGWFTVGGKDATQEEFEQYSHDWEQRPAANWIYLAAAETDPTEPPAQFTSYLEKIPRRDQPIFREPSYDSPYTGMVQLAGVYTIVQEQWDGEGNLWGKLKSGAGWVDLTDIRNPAAPFCVGFAEDALPDDNACYFTLDTPDHLVSLVIRPDEPIRDFVLTQVDISTGQAVFTDTLYSADQLTPDIPLVAGLSFPGDMSCFGIRFTDGSGMTHRYVLSMSLRNGMPEIYSPDY